jgi:hypothetical protein
MSGLGLLGQSQALAKHQPCCLTGNTRQHPVNRNMPGYLASTSAVYNPSALSAPLLTACSVDAASSNLRMIHVRSFTVLASSHTKRPPQRSTIFGHCVSALTSLSVLLLHNQPASSISQQIKHIYQAMRCVRCIFLGPMPSCWKLQCNNIIGQWRQIEHGSGGCASIRSRQVHMQHLNWTLHRTRPTLLCNHNQFDTNGTLEKNLHFL